MRSLFLALLALLVLILFPLGLRLNLTGSMPTGLYWLGDDRPERGDFVAFCAPESWAVGYIGFGQCPGETKPLLKRLKGVPGDTVTLAPSGHLQINGQTIPDSIPLPADRAGRALSCALRLGVVPSGFGVALGQGPTSFDSRYFGLVPLNAMRRVDLLIPFNFME